MKNHNHVFVALCFVLFTLTITTSAASAQYGFVQIEGMGDSAVGVIPTLNMLAGTSLVDTPAGSIGIEGFALVTDGWAELYAGPTYTPIPELTMGLFAGMETGPETRSRFGGSLLINKSWFSFTGLVEWNRGSFDSEQTGVWYKLLATGAPTSWSKLGIEWRRFAGLGPHATISIPHTPVSVSLSWLPLEVEKLDGKTVHLDRFIFGATVGF